MTSKCLSFLLELISCKYIKMPLSFQKKILTNILKRERFLFLTLAFILSGLIETQWEGGRMHEWVVVWEMRHSPLLFAPMFYSISHWKGIISCYNCPGNNGDILKRSLWPSPLDARLLKQWTPRNWNLPGSLSVGQRRSLSPRNRFYTVLTTW